MGQTYGRESPKVHKEQKHREAARFMVVIPSGDAVIARLFLDDKSQVAEFDATTEEVTLMIENLEPEEGALGSEWDQALMGHSNEQRASAKVYTLDV